MNRKRLLETIKYHEGFECFPYTCTQGALTIGYGRNLDANGINEEEAEHLLHVDLLRCEYELRENLSFFEHLSDPRQEVLLNMCFQLGITGLMKFKRMLVALVNHDFHTASLEMLDSRWANQTPERAKTLSEIMKTGVWK